MKIVTTEKGIMFEESSMTFGIFQPQQFFPIEASRLFTKTKLPPGIKTVECLILRRKENLWLVEAKASSPKPARVEDFHEYISEVSQKFIHSFQLFLGAKAGKFNFYEDETPQLYYDYKFSGKIVFVLVIKNADKEWLSQVQDAIENEMKYHNKFWSIEVKLFNEETARSVAKIIV